MEWRNTVVRQHTAPDCSNISQSQKYFTEMYLHNAEGLPKFSRVLPQTKYPPVSWDHSSETCCLLNSFPRITWHNISFVFDKHQEKQTTRNDNGGNKTMTSEQWTHYVKMWFPFREICMEQIHPIFHFMEDGEIVQI